VRFRVFAKERAWNRPTGLVAITAHAWQNWPMPIQTAEHWLQKAALARQAAEQMNTDAAKTSMLEIARLYDSLAEQTQKLERLGITADR
jgi:hypothetical protein